jgi:hypothetical protein
MRTGVVLARALIVTAAVAIALLRFVAIDATSHSNSDTLRPWLIQVALIALVAAALWRLVDRFGRARAGRRPDGR